MENKSKIYEKLEDLRKVNPFSVPEGYFDAFPCRVQEKIHPRSEVNPLKRILAIARPQLALAVSFIVIALVFFFGIKMIIKPEIGSTSFTVKEIHSLNDYDLFFYDEAFLVDYIEQNNIEIDPITIDGDDSEEIINYLMDEDIDIDGILQEI